MKIGGKNSPFNSLSISMTFIWFGQLVPSPPAKTCKKCENSKTYPKFSKFYRQSKSWLGEKEGDEFSVCPSGLKGLATSSIEWYHRQNRRTLRTHLPSHQSFYIGREGDLPYEPKTVSENFIREVKILTPVFFSLILLCKSAPVHDFLSKTKKKFIFHFAALEKLWYIPPGDRVILGKRKSMTNTRLSILCLVQWVWCCLLYTSPSPRDGLLSR